MLNSKKNTIIAAMLMSTATSSWSAQPDPIAALEARLAASKAVATSKFQGALDTAQRNGYAPPTAAAPLIPVINARKDAAVAQATGSLTQGVERVDAAGQAVGAYSDSVTQYLNFVSETETRIAQLRVESDRLGRDADAVARRADAGTASNTALLTALRTQGESFNRLAENLERDLRVLQDQVAKLEGVPAAGDRG